MSEHRKLHATCAEGFYATLARAREQGPIAINGLKLAFQRRLTDSDDAGEGRVFELRAPRSAAHQAILPGKQDIIILWVLDNGLAHFDLKNCMHVSLGTENNLAKAFTRSRFEATLQGLDAPDGMHWAYRCKKHCRLFLAPLAAVSAITWLAPAANALATMLVLGYIRPPRSSMKRDMYSQVPSRQLAAELADLADTCSSIPMFSANESLEHNRFLTPELLATNPLNCKEFDVEDDAVLQDLIVNMERLMPAEPEPHIQEWLENKRAVDTKFKMCDDTQRILAMQMSLQAGLLRNLALEIMDSQNVAAQQRLLQLQIEEGQQKLQAKLSKLAGINAIIASSTNGSDSSSSSNGGSGKDAIAAAAVGTERQDTATAADGNA